MKSGNLIPRNDLRWLIAGLIIGVFLAVSQLAGSSPVHHSWLNGFWQTVFWYIGGSVFLVGLAWPFSLKLLSIAIGAPTRSARSSQISAQRIIVSKRALTPSLVASVALAETNEAETTSKHYRGEFYPVETSEDSTTRSSEIPCGSTLVELLVAIGIIAILVGILIPALSVSRAEANKLKCMANLRSIGQSLAIYTSTSGGSLPWGFLHEEDNNGANADWTTLLTNELKTTRAADYEHLAKIDMSHLGGRGIFVCPEVTLLPTVESDLLCHYSAHPRLMPDSGTVDYLVTSQVQYLTPYKVTDIKRSSDIALIFDASVKSSPSDNTPGRWSTSVCAFALDNGQLYRGTYLTDHYADDQLDPGINGSQPVSLLPYPSNNSAFINTDGDTNYGNIRFRHLQNKVANALMADGHVASFSLSSAGGSTLLRSNVDVNPKND
ncbi:MAG TPA: type II secretion system protein [Tepidisphaeraceae bacterium]|jgi:prepilin-type processing-associated H-X9-DG protein